MSDPYIRNLIEISARAWPAAVDESYDGWRLRWTDAATQRANSVLALDAGAIPLAEKIEHVERFYRDRGQPSLFLITPLAAPADLDARLHDRGYGVRSTTSVQTADVQTVLNNSARADGRSVHIDEELTPRWTAAYLEIVRAGETQRGNWSGILDRVTAKKAFARIDDAGTAAAVGVGVYESKWLGIFGMGSRLDFRRRGAAIAVLRALVRWGKKLGAENLYLQVTVDNEPARALYARMGFTTLFEYHYRFAELPGEPDTT